MLVRLFLVRLFLLLLLCSDLVISIQEDTSEQCLSCKNQVNQLQSTWTNETTVADILKQLQHDCRAYPYMQRMICDKLAAIFVQIPPALFAGMDDLAWPIPDAMCATIMQCDVYCCEENGLPEQVHLSLVSNDFSSMGVTCKISF